MANKKIKLLVVTPTKRLYDDEVDMVIVRGSEGDLGILPGHQAITISLAYGLLKIKNDSEEMVLTILGGFAEINPNQVTILSDLAEWPDEIDAARAEESKERAEKRLGSDSDIDIARAELALRRALVRLEAKSYK